jgi:CRP/FNR family transcriptional activator FtrB
MATISIVAITSRIERLANWILEEERNQGGRGRISFARGKRVLSSRLGMTSKALSRYLVGLSAHGVRSFGREIIIADREALRRLLTSVRGLTTAQDPRAV